MEALIALLFLALMALPFVVLIWLVLRFARGISKQGLALKQVLEDGVGADAEVIAILDHPNSRRVVRYRYTGPDGRDHQGEVADRARAVGDRIAIEVSTSDPSLSVPAELVAKARASRGRSDSVVRD
jgi:hypothetical protein